MYGVGGTIKHKVFRDVKSVKIQITDAESSWIQIYSGSFKPTLQSFFYTMHTISQANRGAESVILALKAQGWVPIRKPKNNWKQGELLSV